MRKLITEPPYAAKQPNSRRRAKDRWPAFWVRHPDSPKPPFVTAYRRKFALEKNATITVHVTADERYDLFLDGHRIGRGPERGDPLNWFYETYELPLKAGEHAIVARTWSLGEMAPMAQMSYAPGFLLSPEGDENIKMLGTGVAPWEAKILPGYSFIPSGQWLKWVGPQNELNAGKIPWGWERGEGDGWEPVAKGEAGLDAELADAFEYDPAPHLRFATLPPQHEPARSIGKVRWAGEVSSWDTHLIPIRAEKNDAEQQAQWEKLIAKQGDVTIPPHAHRRVLIDVGDYVCAYPQITASGGDGGLVRLFWAEALTEPPDGRGVFSPKGNRDEVEGKLFTGQGDEFKPAGEQKRKFEPLWWRSGRYVEVYVETADTPMTIHGVSLVETRYPLEMTSKIESSEERFDRVVPVMVRALQMCSHETYMDCPYYEQLMYEGDTRLECLATYVITPDDRLPRKALATFARSRLPSDLTQSRFPSRRTQIIPPFSLWWVAMLHDYALWRGDLPLIKSLMPKARGVIDSFLANRGDDGLVDPPLGWNFYDWVPGWGGGMPLGGDAGVIGLLNWHVIYTLAKLKDLETWCGEPELAARADRIARELAPNAARQFWVADRKLFSDDREHKSFSEHSQCLALLGGYLDAEREKQVGESLLSDQKLARSTIYFTHYLFETCRLLNRTDQILQRMNIWFDLPKAGLRTTPEMPEPTRSDCHGWGAHPLYHYFASIAGIRPAEVGFKSVKISPQLGPINHAAGALVHPLGKITFDFQGDSNHVRGSIDLPPGLTGRIDLAGKSVALQPGRREFEL